MGKETAVDLASRGGKIYIACRDEKRGKSALEEIKQRSGSENVHFLQLDLASLDSVREFSKKFHSLESKLDILMNNAGVFGMPRTLTKDGFEMHIGVNHLAHFLLTNLLLDFLKVSAPSRVVTVSSKLHNNGKILKDDLMMEKSYGSWAGYANSKVANILHAAALTKRIKGTNVTINSCHPGVVRTEIGRHTSIAHNFLSILLYPIYKNVNEGAQTQIMLALDPELEKVSGKYFDNCKEATPSKEARDEETAEWLWNKSMKLVGA